MPWRRIIALLLLAVTLPGAPAVAQELRPAVVYDVGGRFDAGFNELVHTAMERFAAATGVPYEAAEPQDVAGRRAALEAFADEGRSPILVVGFDQAEALADVAAAYPGLDFAIVDVAVDLPNVRSIVFREHEGAFLAGLLAAMASQTGTVGFVGGMDTPVIRAFACGFRQGARHADPEVRVVEAMAGTDATAFSNPLLGAELARRHIDDGADVVFHAAGGTGLGVLEAMAQAGRLGIGVDANQNGLFPGHVLTSVEKRVDLAVYDTLLAAAAGDWQAGTIRLGIAEGGIDWAYDTHNAALVDDAMILAVEEAKRAIVDGTLIVHDWRDDLACPG